MQNWLNSSKLVQTNENQKYSYQFSTSARKGKRSCWKYKRNELYSIKQLASKVSKTAPHTFKVSFEKQKLCEFMRNSQDLSWELNTRKKSVEVVTIFKPKNFNADETGLYFSCVAKQNVVSLRFKINQL